MSNTAPSPEPTIVGQCVLVTVDKRELELLHRLRDLVEDFEPVQRQTWPCAPLIREVLKELEAWK